MDLQRDSAEFHRADDRCFTPGHVADPDGADSMPFQLWDHLSVGIVLVDRFAKVLFANAAARSMSGGDSGVLVNSRLTARSPARRFDELIQSALDREAVRVVALSSSVGGLPMIVLVSPVRKAESKRSDCRGLRNAAVLVRLYDPGRQAPIPVSWMMDAYCLTRAEAQVAIAIASGATIAEIARRLRISSNTVRTHLRHAFDKTGTRRQTHLCRLVSTLGLARDGGADFWLNSGDSAICSGTQKRIGQPLSGRCRWSASKQT
jgi:DNA-binding CsgD family transcriptional regulator